MKNVLRALCVMLAIAAGTQVVWAYSSEKITIATEYDGAAIIRLIQLQQNYKDATDEEIQSSKDLLAEFPNIQSYADFQKLIDAYSTRYAHNIKIERDGLKKGIGIGGIKTKKVVEEPGI